MKTPFSNLKAHPLFSQELVADAIPENYTRQVKEAHFSFVQTKTPFEPKWVHFSQELADEIGIQLEDKDKALGLLSGATSFEDFKSFAMSYGGHQFGHWAGQLGDGRAINILETKINDKPWTFQLKGAGPTPYSRSADGNAVLRSSIREYLCSEAMHHLGIPTTRALSLVTSGDWVLRDIMYDGNKADEKGAIVCRVSPSFIRFGNFEIFSAREDIDNLKKLTDFTIRHHFPELGEPSKETYLQFFQKVVSSTKEMIVHWQRVGFVHGVMNTDNMSILGLTIDYGPYGWLENYNGSWTPNTTDKENRRYRFENQPNIALWNLVRLANALYPLIEEAEPLEKILNGFKTDYLFDYHKMMCSKLGLFTTDRVPETFIEELIGLMTQSEIDMTVFFRSNTESKDFESFWSILNESSYLEKDILVKNRKAWETWFKTYALYLSKESVPLEQRIGQMNLINPKYVLRNYMAQLAIEDAEKGNNELIDELYCLLLHPYDEQPEMEKWFALRPDWAKDKIGCSMLSCSS